MRSPTNVIIGIIINGLPNCINWISAEMTSREIGLTLIAISLAEG